MGCCSPHCSLITIISSIFVCLMACVLRNYMPNLVEKAIMKNVVLSTTSELYKFWVEPPINVHTKIYVFNYTNHEAYLANWRRGIKPKLVQLGPYVYRHLIRRINITFSSDGDEVEYYNQNELQFMPDLSNGTEEDVVVFPNVLLRAILQSEQAKADILGTITVLNEANAKNSTFISKPVGKYIMDGYEDLLIDKIYEETGVMIVPDGKFSLLKRFEEDGPFRINTGSIKTSEFGKILEYNNKKNLDYWPKNSSCNEIKGTDGTVFPPKLPIGEKLFIFSGKFCRSINLRFEREVEHHGLKANRFVFDTDSFATTNLKYECFCQSAINHCWGPGFFNLGACRNDTPILLSQPHFLNANFRIKNLFEGIAPNHELHQYFVDLETTISLPVNVSASLQINFGIQPIPNFKSVDILPRLVMPLIWISEVLELNDTMAKLIKSMVIDEPYIYASLVPDLILEISVFILLLGVTCSIHHMFKVLLLKKSDFPLMKSSSN